MTIRRSLQDGEALAVFPSEESSAAHRSGTIEEDDPFAAFAAESDLQLDRGSAPDPGSSATPGPYGLSLQEVQPHTVIASTARECEPCEPDLIASFLRAPTNGSSFEAFGGQSRLLATLALARLVISASVATVAQVGRGKWRRLDRPLLLIGAFMLALLWIERIPNRSLPSGVKLALQPSGTIDSLGPRPALPAAAADAGTSSIPVVIDSSAISPSAVVPGRTEAVTARAVAASSGTSVAQSRTGAIPSVAAGTSERRPSVGPPHEGKQKPEMRGDVVARLPLSPTPFLTVDELTPLAEPAALIPPFARLPTIGESRVSEAEAVRHTLRQYESAYAGLDVDAAAKVWPSVDRRALARAFSTVRSQGLTFDSCEIDVAEGKATALCRGLIRFVPKVGSPTALTAPQEWRFSMRKSAMDWKIENVMASQGSTP